MMSLFGNGTGRSTRDRLTKIETLLELRMQQGQEFMKQFGEQSGKLDRLHDDIIGLKELPERVKVLEEHKGKIETFKNRVVGAGTVLGLPIGGISAWTIFEKIGSLIRGP